MWHLGARFSARCRSARLMLGLNDRKGLFQPKSLWFHNHPPFPRVPWFFFPRCQTSSPAIPLLCSCIFIRSQLQHHCCSTLSITRFERGEFVYQKWGGKKSHSFSSSFHSMSHFLHISNTMSGIMPNKNIFAYINSSPVTHNLHLLLLLPFSLDYSKQRLLIYSSRAESQLLCTQLPCKSVFANAQMASLLLPCLYMSMYFVFQGKKLPG